MGMFRSPYERGGVLSKEAIEERKKIYKDRRNPEERNKENLRLCLFFLPLLPLMLFPGFFSKAGLANTAYLLFPYALEAVAVLLTAVNLGIFLYLSRGKEMRREDGSLEEGAVDGASYRKYFQGLQGKAAISCILGIGFVLIELFYLLLSKDEKNYSAELFIILSQVAFSLSSRLFWVKANQVIRNWTL